MGITLTSVAPFVLAAIAYLIVAFTTAVKAKRQKLPVVPFILPWMGNFFEFRHDPVQFMKSCRRKYGPAYKVLLAGQNIIVLSHYKGIASLNKDSTDSFTGQKVHMRILNVITGIDKNLDHLFEVLNTRLYLPLAQSLSPTSMTAIADDIQHNLSTELRALMPLQLENSTILRLDVLISRPLYRAGCLTLFGPTFPLDTFNDFQLLDSKHPQLLMGFPFMASEAVRARKRLVKTFETFLAPLWAGEAVEGVSDLISTVVQEMQVTLTLREAACLLLLFTFGFHSNTWYMVFWLVSHLLVQEESFELIRKECLASQKTGAGTPLIDSAVQEILRWATTNTTIREATKDTYLMMDEEPIFVAKGDFVMADVQSLHYDPEVYPSPDAFKVDRFLDNGSKTETLKPAAFGGGAHICPGRHLATFEIKRFLTIFLQHYKIKAVMKDGEIPRLPRVNRRDYIGTLRASEAFYVELSPIDFES
ncbi:cytochrome P450 [Crepidotus variabilis]|uniref:Cytochrome P450 n=1 Tax=Crepidotus variabilis TaxID=179855 RepID=A0A9P6JJB5_9AGAR|nr:cytochrome P450 [Crepidotus variabilis]